MDLLRLTWRIARSSEFWMLFMLTVLGMIMYEWRMRLRKRLYYV